ncbi:hypothetical protein GMDG_05099 [Pseudogymnoascus destructans 20631-21]|uniref:Uncharacterized protein n=1 Tax=Pseudogymnoascus destructans (strain ATCC MYA-4855 / 20631-21) TaxID=658429 RepID=L8FQC7_PSED2|nr:hypothetical protein GMDG_05099 [Pseudogymnoascus destructans 20631-21]
MPVVGEVTEGNLKMVQVCEDLRDSLSAYNLGSAPSSEDEVLMEVELERGYEGPGEVVVTHPQELAAWYIQASGHTSPECDQCVHANGSNRARLFFLFCVVSGALQGGACCSCVLKHNAAGCSFSTAKTWRPATPPPPQPPKAGKRAGTHAHTAQLAREAAAMAAKNHVVVD